jgi:hypothetical protein
MPFWSTTTLSKSWTVSYNFLRFLICKLIDCALLPLGIFVYSCLKKKWLCWELGVVFGWDRILRYPQKYEFFCPVRLRLYLAPFPHFLSLSTELLPHLHSHRGLAEPCIPRPNTGIPCRSCLLSGLVKQLYDYLFAKVRKRYFSTRTGPEVPHTICPETIVLSSAERWYPYTISMALSSLSLKRCITRMWLIENRIRHSEAYIE